MATRRHHSDKGDVQPEVPDPDGWDELVHPETPDPDGWDELATRIGARGALYMHDPANFPRIKIGRFEAQVEIGRGGFGIVFKAFDPKLKRWVALKLCRPHSEAAIDDLMNEAQVLAGLDHPNIVAVFEPGEHEGSVFFAMPYIDGENGWEFAERRPNWHEVLDVFIDVASGIAAAHEARPPIVHDDIKLSNILIDRNGFARIADFGLARWVSQEAHESEQEGLWHRAGTLHYMAPERLRGEPGDASSDQFSFCVALKRTLDGVLPFDGDTSGELLESIEHTEVRFEDPLPKNLLAIVRIGLSVDPQDRFPDMKTLRAELVRMRHYPLDESAVDEPPPPDDGGPDEPPSSRETTPNKPPSDAPPPSQLTPPRETTSDKPAPSDAPPLSQLTREPTPDEPRRGAFVTALVLVGVVCLMIGWMGRGQVEGPRTSDPSSSTRKLKMPAPAYPGWTNGLASYSHALQAVDRGDLRAGYDAWVSAHLDMSRSTPGLDAELSLLLAKRVDERSPGMPEGSWMANGAAESFELAQSWRRAAKARQLAAELARAANREWQVDYQERCALVNAMGRPC